MHLTPAHTSIPAHYYFLLSSLSLPTQAAARPDTDRDPPKRQPTAAAVMDPTHPLAILSRCLPAIHLTPAHTSIPAHY